MAKCNYGLLHSKFPELDGWKPCVASTFLHHLLARICTPGLLLALALATHSELKILFNYHSHVLAIVNIILLILLYIGEGTHVGTFHFITKVVIRQFRSLYTLLG
jgi:hypothetical protein